MPWLHTFKVFHTWKTYRQQVMPARVSEEQETETQRAFYAGASAMLGLVKHMPDFRDDEQGVAYLQSLEDECTEFVDKIARGES